ncbi:MAG: hypothetical protein JWN04_271 [Myxococcaceae bacterium]|nr:hypothetical protein [Myxococcaceae bacterium]
MLTVLCMLTACAQSRPNPAPELAQARAHQPLDTSCLEPYPPPPADAPAQRFEMRVVREGLAAPWEIFVGLDGWLWLTEREAMRITRVHPETGESRVVVEIDHGQTAPNIGLLGMALDRDALYVGHSYVEAPDRQRFKLVRYHYDAKTQRADAPHDLISGLSADGDHASGRLVLGPDHRLYYSIGDQGKNQFAAKCRPNRAQALPTADQVAQKDWSSYEGKILRLELDGSIPRDNPVLAGVRSHVYSYGHRNVQGLVFTDDGHLYASEHGPKSDDEINLILPGKNYGWPYVAGRLDNRAYEYANWSLAPGCEALAYESYTPPPEVPRTPESAWSHPDFMPPVRTLYSVDSDFPFAAGDCVAREPSCWPTIAPASLDYYSGGLASLGESLLVPSLKNGSVFMLRLGTDGAPLCERSQELFKTKNRYRDLAISPDRRTIYVITDDRGFTSGPTQRSNQVLTHRGAILAFQSLE